MAIALSVSLLCPSFLWAQTFSFENGKLVQQPPLLTDNQTTVFYDGAGRPIRPIVDETVEEDKEEEAEVVVASARQPASYAQRHASVIPNIHMVARRYQSHPALRKVDLNPRQWTAFFQAMIKVESNYNPRAVSHANAIGLAQIIPSTARYLRINVHDPIQNLDGGARYLLEQMQEFGDVRLALAAYNAGPQAVKDYGGIPPFRETQNHVRLVLAEYHRLLN